MNANGQGPGMRPMPSLPVRLLTGMVGAMKSLPNTALALIARFSIAAVFWTSGQTKVDGFKFNFISGEFSIGWPRLSESAVPLFQDEYKLPYLSPELAAYLAAFAEHLFPVLLLIGLGTRLSAAALLAMTLVIQVLVYPGAYATHGTWAAVLLYLMAHGPGRLSLDHLISRAWSSANAR